jgi:hypothetical protein
MSRAPQAEQSYPELERKPPESDLVKEPTGPAASPALGGLLSAPGTDGRSGVKPNLLSNPVMRHRTNGEMRTQVMRQAQQGLGNHKTQQLVEQLRIPADGTGHPLDYSTRGLMESRFATNLSDVRVHTDGGAADSADALAANAYTTGRDIYFAAGKYAPASREGQHLLAHELTHTVQQASGAAGLAASRKDGIEVVGENDLLESQARHTADTVAPVATQPGQPLETGIRRPMEQFLQQPLDQVRVFSSPESRRAGESLGAFAVTVGQNIHLGTRGEELQGNQRKALLAHEAVHTVQQRDIPPATQFGASTPEPQAGPEEQTAEGLSRAFMLHEAGYTGAGLAIRDSIGMRPLASAGAQLARYATNFGEFEDYKFNEVKNTGGTSVGVQLYLKFHPGNNVDAKKIGMTQAAEGKISGAQINTGFYGRRQATSGAGVGYFIDRLAGRPSPLYGTVGTVTAGEDATKLGSYAAPGITALNAAQVTASQLTGMDYGGGSVFGYRYMDGATLKGPIPAEMHDAPNLPVTNSSEQVFETTALAFEGNMAGTYLGSVEWGWRRDAKGVFSTVPVSLKSQGVPTATFLTAASIWNTAKENYGLLANADPTKILKMDLTDDYTVPKGTPLEQTGRGTSGGKTYYGVKILDNKGQDTGRTGVVLSTDTLMGDFGRDTVHLPVPEIYTVNRVGGTVLDGETVCSESDPILPQGTRLQLLGPFAGLPGYLRVQVADGRFTGRRGIIRMSYLTREALGTH